MKIRLLGLLFVAPLISGFTALINDRRIKLQRLTNLVPQCHASGGRSILLSLSRTSCDDNVSKKGQIKQEDCDPSCDKDREVNRRTAVQSLLSIVTTTQVFTSLPSKSVADTGTNETSLEKPNLLCLADLPPVPPDCVRLYLCRHGQTEYNRLKLIQGARTDAPLNETGRKQATRLGKALSHIGDNVQHNDAYLLKAGAHSNLLRARQTASIAVTTYESSIGSTNDELVLGGDDEAIQFVTNQLTDSFDMRKNLGEKNIPLQSLSTLGEVDFGPLNEGKGTTLAKVDMYKTYGSWAIGDIDNKLGGGGESGREVLSRAASALQSLTNIAASKKGSAIVVSHSTYLRMMLALAMDIPLTQAASLEQKNCCVNVLDVSMTETRDVTSKSNLFTVNSIVPQDFQLKIPRVNVVRVNEFNHLNGLV
jgi:broad specificity phosphatase PhoE